MSTRPPDILSIKSLTMYSPTTPYNAAGDNIPFPSVDSRHNWFTQTTAKGGLITVGTNASSALVEYSVAALDVTDNSLRALSSSASALTNTEVPVLLTPVTALVSGLNYFKKNLYNYYCTVQSKGIDIPVTSFVATGADVGNAVYYDYTAEKLMWDVSGSTTAPTGVIINYKGRQIPLGNIIGIITYGATDYYTIKFGSQEGLSTGLDTTAVGDLYHYSLGDIVSQQSDKPSTYNNNHYLYATKIIEPDITYPTFQEVSGISVTIDTTANTYTIEDTSTNSQMVNDCRFWSIPVATDTLSGIVSVYKSDDVTGLITSNAFVVSGSADTTGDIVVDLTSNTVITLTFCSSATIGTPSAPKVYNLINLDSYIPASISTSGDTIPATVTAEVLTFNVPDSLTEGLSGEKLKNTQLLMVDVTVDTTGAPYTGVKLYHLDTVSGWVDVLSGDWSFFTGATTADIDYCATALTTSTTGTDFELTFADSASLTANSVTLITTLTPEISGDYGKVLEYVYVAAGSGYYQLSHNELSGQPLGILAECVPTYDSPYKVYVLAEGVWSSSTSGVSGTIGGMGKTLYVNGATPRMGADLWDDGQNTPGYVNSSFPIDGIAKQKRIGFVLDSSNYMITIYNNQDYAKYLDEIAPDVATVNDATIQIYPKWVRTGLTYDLTSNLETTRFDTKKISMVPNISIQPIAQDVSGNVYLAVGERPPQPNNYTSLKYSNSLRPNDAVGKIAECAGGYWSAVSGTLSGITYDDVHKLLIIESGANTILNPFEGIYLTKTVQSNFDLIDVSGFSWNADTADWSNTKGGTYLSNVMPGNGSPFKHSLPWHGVMVLAHTDNTVAANNKMMLFSYNGYSGYRTNKLVFYNVNILKKVSADGESFVDTNWVGSNPGYTPYQYYTATSTDTYGRYLPSRLPSWSVSGAGLWGSDSPNGWAFKLMYGGGICLKVIGGGTFDEIRLSPPDLNLNTELDFLKCRNILVNYHLNETSKFDNHNASSNDGTAKSFWNSQNTSMSLSANARTYLASTYNHMDVYTDNATSIAYSDLHTYSDLIGSIGIPNKTYALSSNPTYLLSGSPTVFWIDPKEIWVDFYHGAGPATMGFVKVVNKEYNSFTDEITDDTLIEFSLGQTVFSDPDEPFVAIDSVQIAYNEYVDLMDGESVRFYLKNRKVSW